MGPRPVTLWLEAREGDEPISSLEFVTGDDGAPARFDAAAAGSLTSRVLATSLLTGHGRHGPILRVSEALCITNKFLSGVRIKVVIHTHDLSTTETGHVDNPNRWRGKSVHDGAI